MGNGIRGSNYEELLPRFESSTLWSNHKGVYEKSFCRIHQVLFGHPYVCIMDDPPCLVTKGLVLFPKYNVFVLLFLRFLGCGQVMDVVTVDDHYGQMSLT